MSAICGAISLSGREIDEKEKNILKDGYQDCRIDRFEEFTDNTLYMACGIQYFTKEADYEAFPIVEDGVWFVADVIIDNRIELIKKLVSDRNAYMLQYRKDLDIEEEDIQEKYEKLPDGRILYEMYRQYGKACFNDMVGAYTAVWFDVNRNEVLMLSDAVGYRYVHYMIQDGILYFSSLMKPLEQIKQRVQINDRWIADYIGQDNFNAFTESEETPIQDIYRIAPATSILMDETHQTERTIKKTCYWKPFKGKKIRYHSDEEYKEHFLKLYTECVECLLRSSGETSILLSGGYDSSSVACIAAKKLKEQGKTLYSFTSVPFRGYEPSGDDLDDETQLVRKTAEYLGNVECTFMDMSDMNPWYDRKEYEKIAEIPYKSPQNMLWMYEGLKQSYHKNARIMLGGMFGNGTVSFDNAPNYFCWLFQHGKWRKLYQEACGISKTEGYTKKSIIKTAIKTALHGYSDREGYKEEKKNPFHKSFAKKEFLETNYTESYFERANKTILKFPYDYDTYKNMFITLDILRHYGEYAQRNSLYSGVIIRDPTRDKRIIEFVSAIPYDQFTHNGVRRRLIREYMADIIPEHIFTERRTGMQSADMKKRLLKTQDAIKAEMIENYRKHSGDLRIDCDRAIKDLDGKCFEDMDRFDISRHIFTNILLDYLDGVRER